MQIVNLPEELRQYRSSVFVPTMGALHAGHAALIERAASIGGPVVVSIFVNPTQFGPGEDFERYPRTFDADCALAAESGCACLFAPSVETMYPPDESVAAPLLPAVATQPRLEDAHRPDHFAGVSQVVARLFDLVQPCTAIFGEKDYQQLLVIRAMVQSMREAEPKRWGDLEIIAYPTVREADGMALSSRNAYLDEDDRERALGLSRALRRVTSASSPDEAEALICETLREHDLSIDYAVVRDAKTLMPIETLDQPARALIAARLGNVRLIDNALITE